MTMRAALLLGVAVLLAVAHTPVCAKEEPWNVLADWVEAVLSSDPYFRRMDRRQRATTLWLDPFFGNCCPRYLEGGCNEDCASDMFSAKAKAIATLLHFALIDASEGWAKSVGVSGVWFNRRLHGPGGSPAGPIQAGKTLETALWKHPDNPRLDVVEGVGDQRDQYFATFPAKVIQIKSNDTLINRGVVTRTLANVMNEIFGLTAYGLRPSSYKCGGGCCSKPV